MSLVDSCYRAIGLEPRPTYAGQLIATGEGDTTR
jgi:hypothetical protein